MSQSIASMLSFSFMQNALIAAALVSLLCSVVGFFVVLNRMAFIGDGIAHGALGGVALGVWTGVDPVVAGGIFGTAMAWLIGWISRRGRLSEDTAIGIIFSSAMAFGVALLSLRTGYYPELMSFLFGNILAVTRTDLYILAITTALVVGILTFFFKELFAIAFNEEMARADHLPVDALRYLLLTVVAATVVVAVKVVGIILVAALLVTPTATGLQWARGFRGILAVSVVTALTSSIGGLYLSFRYNVASGAAMVLLAALLFALSSAVSPRNAGIRWALDRWNRIWRPGQQEGASRK